ncbi:hypothetical protein ROE7235_03812 [Roseibaca ekhonensis]|uniref:Uncharacterized protein n=1 Tax=Roseinatronobacter ekhonensis TaxID=254356 RepID=A0A3B0MDU1_9RHOB|nr:hypothetical protein [Roseibaca ekhonensis]SUZ34031.1 hypothetical protein ROE7235_03812 [Roseibaca ekhonensis]
MAQNSEEQSEYDDEDEDGRIWPRVIMTPYDRRLKELRDLEAKRDRVLSETERSSAAPALLAGLELLVSQAQERFDNERKHADSEIGRRRYRIDHWRSHEGRDDYNSSRRKKREKPNVNPGDKMPTETV